MLEHILISRVACADNHKLCVLVADALHCIVDKVKSLLIGETGDYSYHILAFVHRKSQLLLKFFLVLCLLLPDIILVEFGKYLLIVGRVEYLIVNTVYDSTQRRCTSPEKSVKLLAEERILYLLCVGL